MVVRFVGELEMPSATAVMGNVMLKAISRKAGRFIRLMLQWNDVLLGISDAVSCSGVYRRGWRSAPVRRSLSAQEHPRNSRCPSAIRRSRSASMQAAPQEVVVADRKATTGSYGIYWIIKGGKNQCG